MSSQPTDPDGPIGRLYADGYDLVVHHGHLVVRRLPYISPRGVLSDGKLVLPITGNDSAVTDAIGDHTIWFVGEEPRDECGSALGTLMNPARDIGDGHTVNYRLSFKPPSGTYPGLYEKVCAYARILSNPAQTIDSTSTPTPGAAYQVVEDGLPFVYRDTNSTRAGLTSLNNVFRGHTIAIVGLGGTGSYILDQVAKTWIDRIILIDGDILQNHNSFRAPGAVPHEILKARQNKAQYFAEEYSRMHTGISFHPEYLTGNNLHLLNGATFVFLAAADSKERPTIMAALRERNVPFIDVGLGISQEPSGLTGLARVMTYLPGSRSSLPSITAQAPDDDYSSNIQIADMNALNAVLAVIRWKRHLGYYATESTTTETIFKLYSNEIRNGTSE